MVRMPRPRPHFLLLLLFVTAAPAAESKAPRYEVPPGFVAVEDPRIEALVKEIVAESGTGREDAWKVLAGLGRGAVPATVAGLARAEAFPRSLLMYALAESGVSEVDTVLLAGTKDPAWSVREAAAAGLSRAAAPDAVPALTRLLADPSWRVRSAAILSFRRLVSRGRADRQKAITALLPLAGDFDDDVRFSAVRALGNLQAEAAIPLFVRGYLESREEERRDACLRYLTHLETAREELTAALLRAMQNSDDRVFLSAAEKYAELTGPKLLGHEGHVYRLLSLLRKGSDTVVASIRIAKVMKNVGPEAVPVLLADLERIYTTPTRQHVASDLSATVLDIVSSILGEKGAPVLAKIMLEWDVTEARRHAVRLARAFHAKELAPLMMDLYFEPGSDRLRTELLKAIAAADPPDLERFLDHAVRSGDVYLQQTAFEVLREREDIELTGSLASALSDENEHARIATNWLILLEKRDRVICWKLSQRLLAHPNPGIREVGARWVFTAPDVADAIALLTKAFETEDGRHRDREIVDEDTARYERAKILGTILSWSGRRGGVAALPLFAKAMTDGDPIVRERALEALTHVKGKEATDIALAALAVETDSAIRRQALRTVVQATDPRAQKVVAEGLAGGSERDRQQILAALNAMDSAPVPDAIADALSTGKWEPSARVLAVIVFTRRGAEGDTALLGRLAAEDPDLELRQEAIRALGESEAAGAVPALVRLLPAKGADLRKLPEEARLIALDAIHALGLLKSKDAVPTLLTLFDNEWELAVTSGATARSHFDAVVQLCLALGRIGDRRAIHPLLSRLLSPRLYRDFGLLGEKPPPGERNLLTALVSALVRFREDDLLVAGIDLVAELRKSLALYRIQERYVRYVAGLFADPRKGGIRRPQPRRRLADLFYDTVLVVIPRETVSDLEALENGAWQRAGRREFPLAVTRMVAATDLRLVLYPLDFVERKPFYLARRDLLIGITMMETGATAAGEKLYAEGLARDPEDPEILNLYAWWLAETGRDLPRALEAALAAGRRRASDPNILDTLGWTLFRMGRTKEAVDRLAAARAIEIRREDPSVDRFRSPLILYHLAAALAADERRNASRRVLTEAILLDDTIADLARRAPWFANLAENDLLELTIEDALEAIPE